MDPTGQQLLKLLFNEGETVCVSNNKLGFHSIPLETALNGEIELVYPDESSIPGHCHSSDLILCALNPINGFRRDCNVTAFRTFLVELDIGDMKTQLRTIQHLKMPFSAQVWSGNKSVHTAIILDEDLPDEKTYREIVEWIFKIVTFVDKNCKNPSRNIRIPGAYREPGKKQRLIEIKKRVSHKELFSWLNQYEHLRPKAREKKVVPKGQADYSRLTPWERAMLTKGVDFADRGRNQTWYSLACGLAKAGYDEEQIIEILRPHFQEERDFKEKEWLTTLASGYKHVIEEKI